MANFETGCSLRNGRFYLEFFFNFFFSFQFDIVIAFIITKQHNDNKAKDKCIFNLSV